MKKINKYLAIIITWGIMGMAHAQVPQTLTIQSKKVEVDIQVKDINNPVWQQASVTTVPVSPQNITNPMLLSPTIKEVRVKSIHHGDKIAFLVEWTDSTRNAVVDADKFCDQVAIQLPLNPDTIPNYMMGNKKGRVHILHWKAVWQEDIEKGFRDVKDAYPNYWVDIYPMAEKQGDGREGFARDVKAGDYASAEGKNFQHGTYAGNPMSIFDRKIPCEEAMAEGYGTLTTQESQDAMAWGVWENNTWKVVIVRPLNSADKNDAPLAKNTKVSFAVWDGAAENISGRKHFSMWNELVIEK